VYVYVYYDGFKSGKIKSTNTLNVYYNITARDYKRNRETE